MIDMIMNLPFRQTTMKYFYEKMLWLIIVPKVLIPDCDISKSAR